AILHEDNLVLRPESGIVKAGVTHVAEIEELNRPGVGFRRERKLHNGAETAEVTPDLRAVVRITGFSEKELGEIAARMKLSIFRPLKGSRSRSLRSGIGVEGTKAVHGSVVNRDPVGPESQAIRVQVADVLAGNVRIRLARVKRNRVSGPPDHLQRL